MWSCPRKWEEEAAIFPTVSRVVFLGKVYDPFELAADPSKPDFKVPDLLPPSSLGQTRLDRRRKMRDLVEDSVSKFETSENAKMLNDNFRLPFG